MPRMTFASLPLPLTGSAPSQLLPAFSLPLLALSAGLIVLTLALRAALQPRKALAVSATPEKSDDITVSAVGAPAPPPTLKQLVKRWGWAALDKLALFLEALEDDEDEEAPAPATLRKANSRAAAQSHQRRWTLDGTSYRLPAPQQAPTKPNTHRRSQSMHGSAVPAPPPLSLRESCPLSSPPAPKLAFSPPPHMRQIAQGVPISGPGARPLSAAKLIMSRHIVRKPYRSPPLPGQPRTTPVSKLAS